MEIIGIIESILIIKEAIESIKEFFDGFKKINEGFDDLYSEFLLIEKQIKSIYKIVIKIKTQEIHNDDIIQ